MQKIKFRLPQGIGDANKGDATAEEWEKRLKETYGSENVKRVESPYHESADSTVEGSGVWDMVEGGDYINGREYSQHAMERMAPNTPSVQAELSR